MSDGNHNLSCEGLSVGYAGAPVIEGLTTTVPRGALTAVCGPNGCGKSTLLLALARVLKPMTGRVRLGENDIRGLPSRRLAKRLTFLPQYPSAPGTLTVRALVERGRDPHRGFFGGLTSADEDAIEQACEVAAVAHLRDAKLDELSGGQRQRAWIALTLAQSCSVMLLDEPTSHLDLAHQLQILTLCRELAQQGHSIVVVLHDLNLAAHFAHHMVLLHNGRQHSAGTPVQVLTAEALAQVFDVEASVRDDLTRNAAEAYPVIIPHARVGAGAAAGRGGADV